jgi:pantoate--beta-alanine ligase
MEVCTTPNELRAYVRWLRKQGLSIALVPTMGYLHAGHMSLVERASREAKRVIVSIFVNPTQFGDPADLEAYPRDTKRDLAILREADIEAVFLPTAKTMYPNGHETIVETTQLSEALHGELRASHFRAVTTVVAKLFNLVTPDVACFGEKDYQQLQVVRTMVRDLNFPVRIVGCPTVREPDGLAISSRNVRLSPEDRSAALVLNRALDRAEEMAAAGTTVETMRDAMVEMIRTEPRAALKSVDITEPVTLKPLSGISAGPLAVMLSAEFGGVLLIDQREIFP